MLRERCDLQVRAQKMWRFKCTCSENVVIRGCVLRKRYDLQVRAQKTLWLTAALGRRFCAAGLFDVVLFARKSFFRILLFIWFRNVLCAGVLR